MQAIKLLGVCLTAICVGFVQASDGFILAQTISSDGMTRSNSGNSLEKKSDSVVISTPKPRERVIPKTVQPSPVIQMHLFPPIPQPSLPIQPPVIVLPTTP